MPMMRIGTPIGMPCPTASVPDVVILRFWLPPDVALLESLAVLPETELIVVPAGIPLPETASPEAIVEAKTPSTSGLMLTLGDPLVSVAS